MRVEELSQPDLPAHSRDDPQVIQALRVIGNVRRRLLHRYPPSRGDTHSTKNPEDTSTKLRNVGSWLTGSRSRAADTCGKPSRVSFPGTCRRESGERECTTRSRLPGTPGPSVDDA